MGGRPFLFFKLWWKGEQKVLLFFLNEAISGKAIFVTIFIPFPLLGPPFFLPFHSSCSVIVIISSYLIFKVQLLHFPACLMFYYLNVFVEWKIPSKAVSKNLKYWDQQFLRLILGQDIEVLITVNPEDENCKPKKKKMIYNLAKEFYCFPCVLKFDILTFTCTRGNMFTNSAIIYL